MQHQGDCSPVMVEICFRLFLKDGAVPVHEKLYDII